MFPERVWENNKTTVLTYTAALTLCVLMQILVLKLWSADFHVPFRYSGDDTLFTLTVVKSVVENGWYLDNPRLGTPFGLEFYDFPRTDHVHLIIIKFLALFTNNYALVANIYYLLTFPFTAFAALYVFKQFQVSNPVAVVFAVLYAFLPYHFIRGITHLFLGAYYLVPFAVLLMVRIMRRDSIRPVPSLMFCVLFASSGIYYTFFAAILFLFAGLFAFIREWKIKPIFTASLLVVVLLCTFLINLSPNLAYSYRNGPNPVVPRRTFGQAELLSLKISNLFIPPQYHRIRKLATWGDRFYAVRKVEGAEACYLGLVGIFGFLILIGFSLFFLSNSMMQNLSALNLAAVLIASSGGFGPLYAFFISDKIRAYNRMVVFIGFFALCAVALLFDRYFIKKRKLFYTSIAFLFVIGILDQTSPGFSDARPLQAQNYYEDDEFIRAIEASLPSGSMVYQLPYVAFPESGPVNGTMPYDHLRGYLHSRNLRWSFAAMEGRPAGNWHNQVAQLPITEMIAKLRAAGFRGIYLDRYGSRPGKQIEQRIGDILQTQAINSKNHRFAFYPISDR